MTTALARSIVVYQPEGDRPAIITKVFSANQVEVCAFMPLPKHLKLVTIHEDRRSAMHATTKDATGYHGYWPAKA